MIKYTDEDKRNIRSVQKIKKHSDAWKSKNVDALKKKIKRIRREQRDLCSYCQISFLGVSNIDIDIEHILPSSKFREYMFTPNNLTIACKQCNMFVKNDRDDFFIKSGLFYKNPFISKHYMFPHPILDDIYKYLERRVFQDSKGSIVKYDIKDEGKGRFVYDYFRLKSIEEKSIDESQGRELVVIDPEKISPEEYAEIQKILGGRGTF